MRLSSWPAAQPAACRHDAAAIEQPGTETQADLTPKAGTMDTAMPARQGKSTAVQHLGTASTPRMFQRILRRLRCNLHGGHATEDRGSMRHAECTRAIPDTSKKSHQMHDQMRTLCTLFSTVQRLVWHGWIRTICMHVLHAVLHLWAIFHASHASNFPMTTVML